MKVFRKLNLIKLFLGGMVVLMAQGCATTGGVYRDASEEQILGDKWNNTDGNKTAKAMIDSLLKEAWLTDFMRRKGRKPVVLVGSVQNRSDEHIDTKALTDAIRSRLINSRKVRFVNAAARERILQEIQYQNSGEVSKATAKKRGRQIGADFMLDGSVSNITSSEGDYKTVVYQTDLNLTNFETSEIEWNGFHKIKKAFKR